MFGPAAEQNRCKSLLLADVGLGRLREIAGVFPLIGKLAGELLNNLAKIDLSGIPYKGGMPAINDLLGGQIPMSFNNGPESIGQLQAGTVRALAVTTAVRAPFLPDVPSMSEAVSGYDTEVWWGLLGPGGMPADLVAKISGYFVAA